MPEDAQALLVCWLQEQFAWLEGTLADTAYQTGEAFTAVDSYLFMLSCWAQQVGVDLSPFPKLCALRERVAARPAVLAAMKAEGLLG
jgi:glutathione S-transferase